MAELPSLGKHCNHKSCNQLDFLPVTCNFCKHVFCKDHFNYLDHNCDSWNRLSENNPTIVNTVETFTCKSPNCKKIEEVEIICPKCQENFCMSHRLEKDHECGYRKPDHMPKTANLVSQILEKSQTESNDANQHKRHKVLNAKAQKTAAKVQLMKLKQKAMGQKAIQQEDRIYFLVHLPLSKIASMSLKSGKDRTKGVFVSKLWPLGKVLDAISDLCSVQNKNNTSQGENQKLKLFKHSSGELLANESYNVLLDQLIKDEEVFNGDTLVLEYVNVSDMSPNEIQVQLDQSKYSI